MCCRLLREALPTTAPPVRDPSCPSKRFIVLPLHPISRPATALAPSTIHASRSSSLAFSQPFAPSPALPIQLYTPVLSVCLYCFCIHTCESSIQLMQIYRSIVLVMFRCMLRCKRVCKRVFDRLVGCFICLRVWGKMYSMQLG